MKVVVYVALVCAFIQISETSPLLEKMSRPKRQLNRPHLVPCTMNDDCEGGMFCDTHYGFCEKLRPEGEPCRHDNHCKDRLLCMFGECREAPKKGHEGARCEESSDCNKGLCCARTKSEKVCKPRLSMGEMCYVPKGGLDFVLDEVCPCEEGLVCGVVEESLRKRSLHSYENLRCRQPNATRSAED